MRYPFDPEYKNQEEFENLLKLEAKAKIIECQETLNEAIDLKGNIEFPVLIADGVFDIVGYEAETKKWYVSYLYHVEGNEHPTSFHSYL